jgi:predicted lipoprotein with Yx(FWY)xxD motif
MKNPLAALSLSSIALLAACGGGGTSGAPSAMTPVAAPTIAPLLTQSVMTTPANGSEAGFATAAGFAVYVFDLDLTVPGTSQCNGVCAQHWPPVGVPTTTSIVAPWGTVTRSDGSKQLAFNGRPLYTYSGDTSPGSATGDGLNAGGGIWHLAASELNAVATPMPAAGATSAPNPYGY